MDNVIDLKEVRKNKLVPLGSYFVRVDLYNDGIAGEVLELGELDGDQLIGVADNLATLSRWYRQQAHEKDNNADNDMVGEFRIYSSSRVWSWIGNQIETEKQEEWLIRKLDDAKQHITPDK